MHTQKVQQVEEKIGKTR